VFGRERSAGMEMHAFAQMKARGALVDLLPALRQPRLERQVLAKAQQWIECEVRELKSGARQLFVRIERGRVCVISHAQGLGRGGKRHGKRGKRSDQKQQTSKHRETGLVL